MSESLPDHFDGECPKCGSPGSEGSECRSFEGSCTGPHAPPFPRRVKTASDRKDSTCSDCGGTGLIFLTAKRGTPKESELRAKGYEPTYPCGPCKGTGRVA